MGSTRLPGKVLLDLCGRTMLARVVRRVRRAVLVDEVIVATSQSPEDDAIVDQCNRLSVACFRGSESDVLERYYQAATSHDADVVVRITADCPLIDPQIIDLVVSAFLNGRPDYASNILQRTYPRGLDTEVMTSETLASARSEASQPYERTHVTPYIYRTPGRFRLLSVTGDSDLSQGRWTVDCRDDLDFLIAIYQRLNRDDEFSWRDVCRLLREEPSLADLNRHVCQKELVQG